MKKESKPFKDMLSMTEASLAEFKKNPIPMKKETIEEAAERLCPNDGYYDEIYCDIGEFNREKWIEGAKWKQQNSYSEEEVLTILHKRDMYKWEEHLEVLSLNEWFEQFKKK